MTEAQSQGAVEDLLRGGRSLCGSGLVTAFVSRAVENNFILS